MPTQEEISAKFAELVGNGLDFLEKASDELETDQKYSIIHFSTGLEILLKARIFAEHWSLISMNPHDCNWSGIKDGTETTIGANNLCTIISTITGTSLNYEKEVFKTIFDHRNKVVHWIPHEQIEETAAEQCRAWYSLEQLLTNRWKTYFSNFLPRISQVDDKLLKYRTHLEVRFKALEAKLKEPEAAGSLIDCPACELKAMVLENHGELFSEANCWVCKVSDSLVRFACGCWLPIYSLPADCVCGDEHNYDELVESDDYLEQYEFPVSIRSRMLDVMDPKRVLSPKESLSYRPNRVHCGECAGLLTEPTVGPLDNGSYRCVNCGNDFSQEKLETCECCDEQWAGMSMEHSYYLGCEHCDGAHPR